MGKIINGIVALTVALLAAQITQAQGTITYLSNLDQPSIGSIAVGSDSWLAIGFRTGPDAVGHSLDSIQLEMADASGNPSGLTVMLYSDRFIAPGPGSSLGTLVCSLNPVSAGTYTFIPISNITLSLGAYWIVLTAGTTVANGAYEWSESAFPPGPNGDWGAGNGVLYSSNGLSWPSGYSVHPQFAINATPIPEPSPSFLLLLGSGALIYVRRDFHR